MTLVVTSIPPRRRLSEGVALRASVVARLLGIRLLTLDATVLVAPAEIAATRETVGGHLTDAARLIDEGAVSLRAARIS